MTDISTGLMLLNKLIIYYGCWIFTNGYKRIKKIKYRKMSREKREASIESEESSRPSLNYRDDRFSSDQDNF